MVKQSIVFKIQWLRAYFRHLKTSGSASANKRSLHDLQHKKKKKNVNNERNARVFRILDYPYYLHATHQSSTCIDTCRVGCHYAPRWDEIWVSVKL